MSIINKSLASIGFGGTQLDTQLEKETVIPGEEIKGKVHIQGGKTEQKVDEIYLELYTTFIKETADKKYINSIMIDRFHHNEWPCKRFTER